MRIISGLYKNRPLLSPKGSQTRPTSSKLRESLFNITQGYIQGADFLDLFAGSGAMGFEALSRGATKAVFIEKSREAGRCIQANIEALGVDNQSRLILGDVCAQAHKLTQAGQLFDIVFADPPYELDLSAKTLKLVDEGLLLKPDGVLFIEEAHGVELDVANLTRLHLVNLRRMGRSLLHQFAFREPSSHL